MIKDKIIAVIKNTFSLDKNDDIRQVLNLPESLSFQNLPRLLSELADETVSSKTLANTIERIAIQIRLKKDQTPKEQEFLRQMKEIIIKPKYDQNFSQVEESATAPFFKNK